MFETRKTFYCKGGEWTTIIHTRFAQLPKSWMLYVPAEANVALGEFEEVKSSWILPGQPQLGPLCPEHILNRGYWNTFYKVRIRPLQTITVTLAGSWL